MCCAQLTKLVSSKDHPFHKFGTGKKIFGHPYLITSHTLEAVCIGLNMCKGSLRLHLCAGNLETLDIGPKSRGVDTRDELVKFYTANYSSNLMRLVVYGRGKLSVKFQQFSPFKVL